MRQLAIIGVQCESAATGREAVEKVANAFFDLILMDVHLPDMTGYEAAYQIRMQQRSRGEKESAIIALTGCTADALREPADAECMDDFLEKPVSIEQLRTCLLKVFHRALGDE
jgi:CheY-like chemotaxis protein